jgi:hypothetical protein
MTQHTSILDKDLANAHLGGIICKNLLDIVKLAAPRVLR